MKNIANESVTEPLQVNFIDLYPETNAKSHKTDKFKVVQAKDSKTTIVRRGQPFTGMICFDRPYIEAEDLVQFVFSLGKEDHTETRGSMYLSEDIVPKTHTWTAKLTETKDDTLSFVVSSPVTLPVGIWALKVITALKSSKKIHEYDNKEHLYILFNPWNEGDQTYMEDSNLLKEYVLNDVGIIWRSIPIPWLYEQFDEGVLPACMSLLDKACIPFHHRGDPVNVTRAISRIVNKEDDDGVIFGRWDGEYTDGKVPSYWKGSAEILSKFVEEKRSVAYGQCWVFAGVVNTVCRAFGIPSRVVTNMFSGHDSDKSMSIDEYLTEDGHLIKEKSESTWNFHVWNDVWMTRPDLPPGYDGWQAIDATPQELSQGKFQCGPAPLKAIKNGDIGVNYDVDFIMASVNADHLHWVKDPKTELGYSLVTMSKHEVGRLILTKKPFDSISSDIDLEDITFQYKYKEGTDLERSALMNGVHQSEKAESYYNTMKSDIKFSLRYIDEVSVGEDLTITLDMENTSDKSEIANVSLFADCVDSRHKILNTLKEELKTIILGPHKKEILSMSVKCEEYLPKLVNDSKLRMRARARMEETNEKWGQYEIVNVVKPEIDFEFNEPLVLNQDSTVVLSLKNPLERSLTGCDLRLLSPGITGEKVRVSTAEVAPKALLQTELSIQPNKLGKVVFLAMFKSIELSGIYTFAEVEVLQG